MPSKHHSNRFEPEHARMRPREQRGRGKNIQPNEAKGRSGRSQRRRVQRQMKRLTQKRK